MEDTDHLDQVYMDQVEDKRTAILEATLRLISQYGFHGTAMSKVAKEAGVSAGIIYHYFASKDALIDELYRTLKRRSSQAMLAGFDADRLERDVRAIFARDGWYEGVIMA